MTISFGELDPIRPRERRAASRLEMLSRIRGEVDTGEAVTLVNISEGGALVHGAQAAKVGEIHEFRFCTRADDAPLVFAARVIHVLRISAAEGTSYALGLEFVTSTERQTHAISQLIAAGTTLLP